MPGCKMREDRWTDRQRDAQVEEKKKAGGREGRCPQTLLSLQSWSGGSQVSPCFLEAEDTNVTGLSGHVLLTPLPSNRVNGREGQAGLKAGSAAACV